MSVQGPSQAPQEEPLVWPEWRHSPWPVSVSRILRVAGLGALVVPIALRLWERYPGGDEQALGPVTLIVAGAIPTNAHVASISFLLGLAALIAAPLVGAWPPRRARMLMRIASPITLGTTVLLALGAWLMIAFSPPHYATLGEPSPGGCRVIVADTRLIRHDSIDIGVLQPGSTRVVWIQRGNASVGTDPFTQLDLSWRAETGTVSASVPSDSLAYLDGLALSCAHDQV